MRPVPSALPDDLAGDLDRAVRVLSRGIITFEEFLGTCLEEIGQAARLHSARCPLGGEPSTYHDESIWRAAQDRLDEELGRLGRSPEECQHLHETLAYMRDRPGRWWAVTQVLQRISRLGESPSGVKQATALALGLLREGCLGDPLEDRQVESLARTLRDAGLDGALLEGWPLVPDNPPGHGRRAWQAAVLATRASVDVTCERDAMPGARPL